MQVITIGIDLAKSVFHVHGIDANDKVVFNKPLRRSQVLPFFAKPRRASSAWKPVHRPITGHAN